MMKKRHHVVAEILKTENTYVSQLNLMVTMFVDQPACGLTQDQILQVFANVKVIAMCHKNFLEPLQKRVAAWMETSKVGDLFRNARWIKLYKHYINTYENAAKLVKEWRETNKAFKKYLKEVEWTPALQCTNLESLLVTPIQRLPRYVLLLEEMAKATPESHPDHADLTEAIELVRSLTDYVNRSKRDSTQADELKELEQKFVGLPFELVKLHRTLVKEGPLRVDKDAMHLWLFSDIGIITKPAKRGKYKYRQTVNLNTAVLQQHEGASFKLVSTGGSFNATCASVQERMAWYQALSDTISAVQASMLKSAFVSEVEQSEGSSQFKALRLAEMAEHRAEQFKALLASETEYLKVLELTRSTFLNPIKRAAMDKTNTMVTVHAAKTIVSNFSELRNMHKAILRALKPKDAAWSKDSTVSDVFGEHIDRIVYVYRNYIDHNAVQVAALDACCAEQESFRLWLLNIEADSGKVLSQLLRYPLRRISEYYIAMENMLQNTDRTSDDYANLVAIVGKLSALNDEFTVKNTPRVVEAAMRATKRS